MNTVESLELGRFNVEAYLQRIGFQGTANTDWETLRELQYRHLHSVPYENLDILMGVPLDLRISHLYEKIVAQGRGGYCFESNGLFRQLLVALGFPLTSYFARFWRDEGNPPPKPRHHILVVTLGKERYLVDVGVGGIVPRWPLLLADGLVQEQDDETYRMVHMGSPYGWMLEEYVRESWRPIFSFAEQPQLQRDFLTTSFWCEHAAESIFRGQPMVMVRTEAGRHTYDGRQFKIFDRDTVTTKVAQSADELVQLLHDFFGIDLSQNPNAAELWRFQQPPTEQE